MKFKKIENNFCYTICDKLTRFEPALIRYKNLFNLIVSKYYLDSQQKNLSDSEKIQIACEILNSSFKPSDKDKILNELFIKLEEKYFYYSDESYQYLSCRLNLFDIVSKIKNISEIKKNVSWFIELSKHDFFGMNFNIDDICPIKKVILCEGQTEYILLGTLFNLFGINLDKYGIYIVPAGGKNPVVKKYYYMADYYKTPFFILLDNDGIQVEGQIRSKLRKQDFLYIIKCGEFEDLIPVDVIMNTLNSVHKNDFNCTMDDFSGDTCMVQNIKNIYKKYGFGEFKKANFAKYLNHYITENCLKSNFLESEIRDIITSFLNF